MSDEIYGIDLGTTYSAVARVSEHGTAEIINNFEGDATTPSAIFFEGPDQVIVGAEAKNVALTDPDNSVQLIKRHMGEEWQGEYQGTEFTPESLSAIILRELVNAANDATQSDVNKVIITVPAYFGIREKEATKQAGMIAGLDVVGIVTEPVAAALSLGIRGEIPETILIYDLGGGTFDTTIMKVEGGKVEVIAIDGNRRLGGADWDTALVDLIVAKFVAQSEISDDPTLDEEFMIEVRRNAEDLKKSLSKRDSATTMCHFEAAKEKVEVTRAEFERATEHLVSQTVEIAERTVASGKAKDPELAVDRVLLVGGSSRMPMVVEALRSRLGWDPIPTDFDLAVAKGAAIYGQAAIDEVLITDGTEAPPAEEGANPRLLGGSVTITNVLSRGLGIEFADSEGGSYVEFMVHANDTLPAAPAPISAQTVADGQTTVQITLYEQGGEVESTVPADNRELKSQDLPVPSLPKGSPIEVEFGVTDEGLATLKAHDPKGGETIEIEARVSVLSAEEVEVATAVVAGISLRS